MTDKHTEEPKTSIKAFSKTEAALATLRERYAGIEYEVATPEGMKLAKAGRKELRGYRTGLEKARKEEKEEALRRCQTIDTEARRITAELRALEDPIAEQIDAEQRRIDEERAAKIKAEEERVERIMTRIEDVRNSAECVAWDTPAKDIAIVIAQVEKVAIDAETFGEFQHQAVDAKDATLARLRAMLTKAEEREADEARRKAEQEELEKLRAEAAAREAKERAEREAREEAERKEREAKEAAAKKQRDAEEAKRRAEAEKLRKAQAAEQARIDAENKRLAEERAAFEREQAAARKREAEAKRKKEADEKAEAERKERAEAMARKKKFPGVDAIVNVLCDHYGVTPDIVHRWLAQLRNAA